MQVLTKPQMASQIPFCIGTLQSLLYMGALESSKGLHEAPIYKFSMKHPLYRVFKEAPKVYAKYPFLIGFAKPAIYRCFVNLPGAYQSSLCIEIS